MIDSSIKTVTDTYTETIFVDENYNTEAEANAKLEELKQEQELATSKIEKICTLSRY